jgi:pyrimidine operon attenuation protein/uracil phosphoribosyltransferase
MAVKPKETTSGKTKAKAAPSKSTPKPSAAKAKVAAAKKPTAPKKPAAKKSGTAAAKRPPAEGTVLMTAEQLAGGLKKLADAIHRDFPSPERLVLLGIRTRGAVIADRLEVLLSERYGRPVATGVLDITFYRDDLSRLGPSPMVRGSELPFDIHDASIVLIDDVLYTGRTIRAALDEISDFGRPAVVRLAVFVDRGLREYPIQADYTALKIDTTQQHTIHVRLEEVDDTDEVILGPSGK